MLKIRRFPLFSFLFAALLLGSLMLSGCTDNIADFKAEADLRAEKMVERYRGDKLRNAHLLTRAVKTNAAGKFGNENALGLILNINKQSTLERYQILERFATMERYDILERFEYNNVFGGYAITVEDSLGLSDYQTFLDALENDPDILWYEPDFSVVNPSPTATEGSAGQQIPWSVAAIGGQESWTNSGDGSGTVDVDIYVLDTGVSHDDINLVEEDDLRDGDVGDDDQDDQDDDWEDYDGHGTHIAGIIAAIDDADGLVGVAPGAKVHNLKVLGDDGTTDVSVVIAAVEYITNEKMANPSTPLVVNMSIGENIGTTGYTALDEAVEASIEAGVVYVVAAGNQGDNASNVTPAKVKDAITVGSHDVNGLFSSFSNWGPKVDILAPGEGVISLSPNGTVVSMSGTSMSTAHVTGAAALYLAQNPTATSAAVKAALLDAAKTFVVGQPPSTTNKSVWVGGSSNMLFGVENALVSKISGKCLSVKDASLDNDANILQWSCNSGENQLWDLLDTGSGYYQLKAKHSGKCLDVAAASMVDGADVLQWDCHSGDHQQWALIDAGSGYYQLKAKHSGKCLDVAGSSMVDGGDALQWACHGGDNQLWSLTEATVPSTPPQSEYTQEVRISSSYDDAEQKTSNGYMSRTNSDLELIADGSTQQLVGMRFAEISIPQGATITSAYVQFTVDETNSGTTNLTIKGQDADNAASFSSSSYNISSRTETAASVPWSPAAWNSVGAAGADQRTPDLASVIQEIVSRPGWTSCNAVALVVSGTGERTAESYNGSSTKAPLLHVEWEGGSPGTCTPPPSGGDDDDD